ncbi:dTMP kinase [Spiroplasma turonicum]|uniref:Thymidylate kinase n=1 Tax=Spiroplasma turonicum TaxID=216946 RepID=A0A0K1P517_9MOLU|nr:dTMP kinase [Spiroplasma turonicum]AKU79254.1 thymidylate kinase [Spiroplasma turonicum]ALX70277.1 thymidylate kinase [Spiroplasma turonicum]
MLFISLEGIDGSGKTTISKMIKDNLSQKGFKVLLTREPGGETFAEDIRQMILDKKNIITPWTETLLYIAARKQHLDKVVIPALKAGTIVICDRFMDSTSAYQGYARNVGMAEIDEVQNIVLGSTKPDLTIFFDITPKEAHIRLLKRKRKPDRLESEDSVFHEAVYEGYQILISENTDRIKVVNSRKPINEVLQQVDFLINDALNERLSKND